MITPIAPATQRKLRVLLIDDSAFDLFVLQRIFALAPDLEVVATARNGKEGLEALRRVQPDIVCTDYHMPVMDGLAFIEAAMATQPCPIVVISVAVQSFQKDNIFRLLAAGAVDVLAKPLGSAGGIGEREGALLLEKIRAIAAAPVLRRKLARPAPASQPARAAAAPGVRLRRPELVAIGASTGGPQALQQMFSQLPRNYPVPLVCVQHISSGFLDGMMSWLQASCKLRIVAAQSGSVPQPGVIHFAPDGAHLGFDARRRFMALPGTGDLHCPGIDALFDAVAAGWGASALGVLLSGMGRDGARGLLALRKAGALTVAQDEASSVIFGMPAAAIALGAAEQVLPPAAIGQLLVDCVA